MVDPLQFPKFEGPLWDPTTDDLSSLKDLQENVESHRSEHDLIDHPATTSAPQNPSPVGTPNAASNTIGRFSSSRIRKQNTDSRTEITELISRDRIRLWHNAASRRLLEWRAEGDTPSELRTQLLNLQRLKLSLDDFLFEHKSMEPANEIWLFDALILRIEEWNQLASKLKTNVEASLEHDPELKIFIQQTSLHHPRFEKIRRLVDQVQSKILSPRDAWSSIVASTNEDETNPQIEQLHNGTLSKLRAIDEIFHNHSLSSEQRMVLSGIRVSAEIHPKSESDLVDWFVRLHEMALSTGIELQIVGVGKSNFRIINAKEFLRQFDPERMHDFEHRIWDGPRLLERIKYKRALESYTSDGVELVRAYPDQVNRWRIHSSGADIEWQGSIKNVAVMSCNRPEALGRSLEAYSDIATRFRHPTTIWVFDDSADGFAKTNRQMVTQFRRHEVNAKYFGSTEKQILRNELEDGISHAVNRSPEFVSRIIDRILGFVDQTTQEWRSTPSAQRNWKSLWFSGTRAFHADDDTLPAKFNREISNSTIEAKNLANQLWSASRPTTPLALQYYGPINERVVLMTYDILAAAELEPNSHRSAMYDGHNDFAASSVIGAFLQMTSQSVDVLNGGLALEQNQGRFSYFGDSTWVSTSSLDGFDLTLRRRGGDGSFAQTRFFTSEGRIRPSIGNKHFVHFHERGRRWIDQPSAWLEESKSDAFHSAVKHAVRFYHLNHIFFQPLIVRDVGLATLQNEDVRTRIEVEAKRWWAEGTLILQHINTHEASLIEMIERASTPTRDAPSAALFHKEFSEWFGAPRDSHFTLETYVTELKEKLERTRLLAQQMRQVLGVGSSPTPNEADAFVKRLTADTLSELQDYFEAIPIFCAIQARLPNVAKQLLSIEH